MNDKPDMWEPVTIQDLLNMDPPTSGAEHPDEGFTHRTAPATPVVFQDIRLIDYDKIHTIEDIKTIFEGLELIVDYNQSSEKLRSFLKDSDE
jgi:hypothetical protein